VGAGFWLQEPAAVRRHAEALAKAKYAEGRDPRTCALFYAALGKKNLLQVTPAPPLGAFVPNNWEQWYQVQSSLLGSTTADTEVVSRSLSRIPLFCIIELAR